jgi:type II secretory pathway pseudopilin PulG
MPESLSNLIPPIVAGIFGLASGLLLHALKSRSDRQASDRAAAEQKAIEGNRFEHETTAAKQKLEDEDARRWLSDRSGAFAKFMAAATAAENALVDAQLVLERRFLRPDLPSTEPLVMPTLDPLEMASNEIRLLASEATQAAADAVREAFLELELALDQYASRDDRPPTGAVADPHIDDAWLELKRATGAFTARTRIDLGIDPDFERLAAASDARAAEGATRGSS